MKRVTWSIYVAAVAGRPALMLGEGKSSPEEALAALDHYLGHARTSTVEEVGL
jgi:hypothetical protein